MASNDIDLKWDMKEFEESIAFIQTRFQTSILILCEVAAAKMEEYAKDEAIWIDRTSNARQKLIGQAYYVTMDQVQIAVSHQMDYGIWLELAHGRDYAILETAIEENIDELLNSIKRLIGRLD